MSERYYIHLVGLCGSRCKYRISQEDGSYKCHHDSFDGPRVINSSLKGLFPEWCPLEKQFFASPSWPSDKKELVVEVIHLGEGDKPFVHAANGNISGYIIEEIERDLKVYNEDGELFAEGPGKYLFKAKRDDRDPSSYAPYWMFDFLAHRPLRL